VAVRFNYSPDYEGIFYYAYDEAGWHEDIQERKDLDLVLAKKAVALLFATEGDVEVSKCPMPRHGVVLLDGDQPVASINVCFECGDIMIWPPWINGRKRWEEMTPEEIQAALAADEPRQKRQQFSYQATFPKWKTFFRDQVGFTIALPPHVADVNK
jgi:hypothetical protein